MSEKIPFVSNVEFHTEGCVSWDKCYEADEHFGMPRRTAFGSHSCECVCHGIFLVDEEKIEGPIRKYKEAEWKIANR